MRHRAWGALFLSAFGLAEGAPPAPPADVKASIASVTVYSDRARVTRRSGALPLAGGRTRLVLKALPDALEDDSVRVSFPDAPWARVLSVEVERQFQDRFNSEEAAKRQEAVRVLEEEGRRLDAREQALSREAELLQGLAVGSQPKAGDQPQPKPLAPESWGKVLDEVARGLDENARARVESAKARRDWGRRMAAAQQAMGEVQSMRRVAEKAVAVEVDGTPPARERAANVRMEVSYLIPGARWSPSYDVRVIPEDRRVQVCRYAEVCQQTGEDWTDAELVCSTAIPAVSATLPELLAWTFSEAPREVPPPACPSPVRLRALKTGSPESNAMGAMEYSKELADHYETDDAAVSCEAAYALGETASRAKRPGNPQERFGERGKGERRRSKIEHQGYAWKDAEGWIPPCQLAGGYDYAFPAVKPESVRSNGKPSRIALGTDLFPAAPFYEAAPLASPFAYLVCEIRNTSGAPYLAGPANLFLAGDFLGTAPLKTVAVGETATVPLGVDEKIKVVRKAQDLKGTAGFFRNKQRTDTEVEISVTSFLKEPVKLRLLDRSPYAFQEEVEVEVGEVRPAPREPARKGVMVWDLALDPGKARSVSFRYGVTTPEDFDLDVTPDMEGAR